jgi:hypothetical protein
MPYITESQRRVLANTMIPQDEGELNYCITQIIRRFVTSRGNSYATYNAVMGALSCAGHEFYRRVAVPYEDEKIRQNGDVY